ncbi:hypothetical protein AYI69_g11500 [Smittium culicis]|uniref:Uncharacterized protein n=1 Tax=Smittium culicis TaxID=133412 RepID=A0A1R1WY22_9FUNG|nr:hypothetical protein AYI69_g11500 [Smittium culicis]
MTLETPMFFSSKKCSIEFKNLKVTALGKQELELDILEGQWRFLETQGLGTYAIDLIVSYKQHVRRRYRINRSLKIGSPTTLRYPSRAIHPSNGLPSYRAKLCWLLSVTDFLRASKIHMIDNQRSRIIQEATNTVVVAPKEKRGGRPIKKSCQTNPPHRYVIIPCKCIRSL